jgi:hypothetical protein
MKSTIALIIALVSLTLTSGNIIYSLSLQKRNSELESLALAFFKEEEAKRAYYNRVQQDNRNAEAALDIPMLPTDVPLNVPPTGQKSK